MKECCCCCKGMPVCKREQARWLLCELFDRTNRHPLLSLVGTRIMRRWSSERGNGEDPENKRIPLSFLSPSLSRVAKRCTVTNGEHIQI
mmetsp:Transcript_34374/g.51853  ORF Transcript_34374/g.51853 Transcript_34374/m.51853 type:complete len:89 (-) Transcript_34374:178-444(-)